MTIIEPIREAIRQCQLNCLAKELPFQPDDYKLYKEKMRVDKEFKALSSEEKQQFLRFLMVENHFYEIKDQELCCLLLASLLERGIVKTRQMLQQALNMEVSNDWSCRNMQALKKEENNQKFLEILAKNNKSFKPFQNNQGNINNNVKGKNVQNKNDSDDASTDDENECPPRFEYSDLVVKVQKLLNENKEKVIVDGIFDDKTEKAISSYQRNKGLVADGLVSKNLIEQLEGKKNLKNDAKLGGVNLKADIKTVKKIRGVTFTKSGQVKFLVDKGIGGSEESGVNSEELALCLSVYFDTTIKNKNISFSLDPWEENNPSGPYQQKVLYPDVKEHRKVLEGSKFGELMFECDYLLKQMSLGLMPDCVTQFNYPQELIQKGLKSLTEINREQEQQGKQRVNRWSRLWLVCRKISGVVGDKQKKGVFLSDDVQIGVDARQMEQDEKGKLVDKQIQDPSDPCYIFAKKFSELYPVVCKYYPCFESLKKLYRASAMAKWIAVNGVQVDLKKVSQVAAKQFMNPNNYQKKVASIGRSSEISLGQIEKKIPVDARTVAIRSLKQANYEVNETNIKSAIEQAVKQNGGSNVFYDIQRGERRMTNYVFGGVDMNCEVEQQVQQKEPVKKLGDNHYEENDNNSSFWSDASTEIDDKTLQERVKEEDFGFNLEADCVACKKALSQQEMKFPVENKHYCSLHHPYRCFYCGKQVTNAAVQMNGRPDLYDAESFRGKVVMHLECSFIFQGKCIDRATTKAQNEQISSINQSCLKQVQANLPQKKSLSDMTLKKPGNFTCQLCKKINSNSTAVTCSLCGLVNNQQINASIKEAIPNARFA